MSFRQSLILASCCLLSASSCGLVLGWGVVAVQTCAKSGADPTKPKIVVQYADEKPIDSGDAVGRSRLVVSPATLVSGETAVLRVTFDSESATWTPLFNPFFNRLLPIGRRIVIFDRRRRYVGEIGLERTAGSSRGPGTTDWITLEDRSSLSVEIDWKAGSIRPPRFGMPKQLAPGRYEAQIIYSELAFCSPSVMGYDHQFDDDERRAWATRKWKQDVCRSPPVPFEIVSEKALQ